MIIGRVIEILSPYASRSGPIIVLDVFQLAQECHPIYRMPRLGRRLGEEQLLNVKAEVRSTVILPSLLSPILTLIWLDNPEGHSFYNERAT